MHHKNYAGFSVAELKMILSKCDDYDEFGLENYVFLDGNGDYDILHTISTDEDGNVLMSSD